MAFLQFLNKNCYVKRFQVLAGIWITGAITKKAEALAKNPKQLTQKSSCDLKKASQVYSFLTFLITPFFAFEE